MSDQTKVFIEPDRIESKVERLTECGCWVWMGAITSRGYGQLQKNNKKIYAHRASYMAFKGDIPDGMYVCHTCDNVSCVNPDHLFLGSQKDNMQDMKNKGRSTFGEKNGQAKLTPLQILQIKAMKKTQQKIADCFGISRQLVGYIKSGKRWGHV